MSTLARTPGGDLDLPTIGNGANLLVTDPVQAAAIKLADGLSMIAGEWFLDTRIGFPWRQVWGQKAPQIVAIRQLLRKAILELGAPVVTGVTDLAVFTGPTRNLLYTFTASTNSGATISGGEGLPFIVSGPVS